MLSWEEGLVSGVRPLTRTASGTCVMTVSPRSPRLLHGKRTEVLLFCPSRWTTRMFLNSIRRSMSFSVIDYSLRSSIEGRARADGIPLGGPIG
jgi:hypothetical protein